MAVSASSSTSSTSQKYDVFLSFRGEDTRSGITSHIYSALTKRKIETYMDDKSLERGHEISPALLEAIERSKISVVILSEDYASSSWCLSELVHILKCRNERGQVVLPFFYEVDPSHVRKQDQGSYRDAFKKHEKKFKDKSETVREWRLALKASADIAGIHYSKSSRPESTLVEEIVEEIMKELSRPEISDDDFKGLVGMQKHYRRIESLLSIDSSRVRIISIWGMAGIGKTTIADAVFTRLSNQFESSYFLKNVREESEKYGLEKLRNEIIAKLLGDEKLNSGSLPNRILKHTKDRLRRTRILLVLDDVSEKKQLESLASDHFFGRDSRIIVTTRDEGVFRGTTILADFEKYGVELLSFEESLQLFNLKTFGENSAPTDYQELSDKVVRHVGRNPLAITVLGSHLRSLRNPTKENWEMELEKLKVVPHDDIIKVLQISYDGLDKTEQKIFLDIACFFKRRQRGFVENILNACNLFASTGIDFLIDKSLITVDSCYNILDMHDLVQQMGWHIVREESEEPSERSRIWTVEDAFCVLNDDMGTGQIEGISLDISGLDEDVYLKPTVFQRMNKLRLLKIYHSQGITFSLNDTKKYQVHLEALDFLPRSLRYLEWYWYPLKSLPSNFNPCNLVEIKMPYSQLEQLWHGIKNIDKLKGIDVRSSVNLTQIPDLSCAKNLETINLENCTSLLEVPWHILQNLSRLSDVNLSNCKQVGSFPDRMDTRGLKTLNLSGCLNLKTVPNIISRNLVSLNISSTAIVNVPSSIGSIKSLSKLLLMNCGLLKSLPSSISQLKSLETLSLIGCLSLEKFPELPMNIEDLSLSNTVIKEVPASFIENRSFLQSIHIIGCKLLESLPSNIFELASLTSLSLSGCSNLENLPEISSHVKSNLKSLYVDGTGIRCLPSSIGNLKNVEELEMRQCKSLEFVGNTSSLSMSSLKFLSLKNCERVQCLSHLPLSLEYLDATGCSSLDIVLDSTSNEFKKRFWDHGRKVKYNTFDYSVFSECLRLDQSAVDNIITEFQLKALQMATQYVAPRYFQVITSPAITTCCSGEEIPNWFNYVCHCSDDWSGSVTIPLPAKCPSGDMLGFALCAVVAGKSCTLGTDIFCEIKLISDGLLGDMMNYPCSVCSPFTGPDTSVPFPVSDSNQVVMWYKHLDFPNLYRSDAKEVSFEFQIKERPYEPSAAKLIKCGVHVLSKSDLDELGVSDHNYICAIQNDHQEYNDSSVSATRSSTILAPPETSLALEIVESDTHDPVNNTIHEHSNSALWHILLSTWSALLLCCSREVDRGTHGDENVSKQIKHDVDALQ